VCGSVSEPSAWAPTLHTNPMRVIFFGTSAFAVPSLEQLVAHHHIVAMCVTQPDRPQGRGLACEPSPVKQVALRFGLPLSQPERVRLDLCDSLQVDVGVVAAYGQLIPDDVLKKPPHGMLGVHPSLLPKYRGASPVAWALLNGETTTGVTIFRLNERLDAGELIVQQSVAIEPTEHAETLTNRLAQLGAQQLVRALELLHTGRAMFTPQEESQATFAPKFTKAQGRIDWHQPAAVIARLVRATVPWPGAMTAWKGEALKIWSVSLPETSTAVSGAAPGTIVHVGSDGVTVATGTGALCLHEVQAAGRRRMTIKEFLAGHPMRVGERFGGDRRQETRDGGTTTRERSET